MSNETTTVEIFETTAQVTATDRDEAVISIFNEAPAIINGIPYALRAYAKLNNGRWRMGSGWWVDRLKLSETGSGYERDWQKAATDKAMSALFRAAIEIAEDIGQDQLDAGQLYRLGQKVTSAKEDLARADAAYDAAKNLLAEAEAQLAAGVLS